MRNGNGGSFFWALLSHAQSVLNLIAATEEEARSSLVESLTHFPNQMSWAVLLLQCYAQDKITDGASENSGG